MNELIILGFALSIAGVAIVIYAGVEVAYQKLVLHSKKSIFDIISEL